MTQIDELVSSPATHQQSPASNSLAVQRVEELAAELTKAAGQLKKLRTNRKQYLGLALFFFLISIAIIATRLPAKSLTPEGLGSAIFSGQV